MATGGSGDGLDMNESSENDVPSPYGRGRGRGRNKKSVTPSPKPGGDSPVTTNTLKNPEAVEDSPADTSSQLLSETSITPSPSAPNTSSSSSSSKLRRPFLKTREKLVSTPDQLFNTSSEGDKPKDISVQNDGSEPEPPVSSQLESEVSHPANSKSETEIKPSLNVGAAEFVPQFTLQKDTTSSLNASAAEFVPRSFATNPSDTNQEITQLNSNFERLMTTVNEHLLVPSEGPNPVVIDDVKQTVFNLTINPGNLEEYVVPLVEQLNYSVQDTQTVIQIIAVIFEQAITEPNFTYTGARMCEYFCHNFVPVQGIPFRNHLLERLKAEHMMKENVIQVDSPRVCGFTMFMAELFLHMKINGQHIHKLGQALQDLLYTLLMFNSDSNLRCVVNVLKLSGAVLEDCIQLTQGTAEPLFLQVQEACLGDNFTSNQRIKDMLRSVLQLRNSNWGRSDVPPPAPAPSTSINNKYSSAVPYRQLDPVFYDPSGRQITRKQAGYDQYDNNVSNQEYVPQEYHDTSFQDSDSEEIDEEMMAAYEEFLLELDEQGL